MAIQRRGRFGRLVVLSGVLLSACVGQNLSGDARSIALGGAASSANIALRMADDGDAGFTVVVPLALLQVLQDRWHLEPTTDHRFDPILTLEYAVNPLHFTIGRNPGWNRGRIVQDAIHGGLTPDLNAYRGLKLANRLDAEGLFAPSWGKTFKLLKRAHGGFQGIYAGAGPYLSARAGFTLDEALTSVLMSETEVPLSSLANRKFLVAGVGSGQAAAAFTAGYRARFPYPGRAGRDGLYIGLNYHFLRGFHYSLASAQAAVETGASGLVMSRPTVPRIALQYEHSRSGWGRALDVDVASVTGRLQLALGVHGAANHIDWRDAETRPYAVESVVEGGDLVTYGPRVTISTRRVTLPVDYTGSAAYRWQKVSLLAAAGHGYEGSRLHAGLEYRMGRIEWRGGARRALERWHPAGGIGVELHRRVSLDFALFGTTANVTREMLPGFALSLRFRRVL